MAILQLPRSLCGNTLANHEANEVLQLIHAVFTCLRCCLDSRDHNTDCTSIRTWEEECPKSRNSKAVETPELSVLTTLHQFTSLPLRCASSWLLPAPVSYLLSKRCLLRFELHCPGCVELRCLQSHSLNVHLYSGQELPGELCR